MICKLIEFANVVLWLLMLKFYGDLEPQILNFSILLEETGLIFFDDLDFGNS